MKTRFLEDTEGNKSSTRLFCFLLLLFFFVFNILWLFGSSGNGLDGNLLIFDIIVLSFVFGPKYAQKLAEKALDKNIILKGAVEGKDLKLK